MIYIDKEKFNKFSGTKLGYHSSIQFHRPQYIFTNQEGIQNARLKTRSYSRESTFLRCSYKIISTDNELSER